MATYVIGDIHGNLPALNDLLHQLSAVVQKGDDVVFLGDYIDRGPDSKGCLSRILAFKSSTPATMIPLVGNHEEAILRTRGDYTSHSWLFTYQGLSTIASYSKEAETIIRAELQRLGSRVVTEEVELPYAHFFDTMPKSHLDFFDSLNVYYRNEYVICTHGGLDPLGGPVEDQPRELLVWGVKNFAEEYQGSQTLVYGHWNNARINRDGLPEPAFINQTIGIDMSKHGHLCAVRLPDRQVYRSAPNVSRS
jgi:serine/threonine protein phosphatase 1